jgi:hypothetical protein
VSNLLIRFFKNASGSGAEEGPLILAIVMVGAAVALGGLHDTLVRALENAAALFGGGGGQSTSGIAGN